MDLGVPELLIIAFVVVLLFGSKKLPGAAKSIGQSLRIFRDETKGLRGDDKAAEQASALPAEPPAALPAPATTVTTTSADSDAPVSTPQS